MNALVRCASFGSFALLDLKYGKEKSKPNCAVLGQERFVSGSDSELPGLAEGTWGRGQTDLCCLHENRYTNR